MAARVLMAGTWLVLYVNDPARRESAVVVVSRQAAG